MHHAASHIVEVDRRLHLLGQLAEGVAGVSPVDAGAGHHCRTLGVREQLCRFLHQRGVSLRAALGAVLLRHLDRLFLNAAEEDVGRDLEEDGAVAASERDAERLREVVLDAIREGDRRRPLRDWTHHLDGAGDLLQRAHQRGAKRRGATDDEQRAGVLVSGGHRRDGVGDTRAGCDDGDAALAGEAAVALGGVAGGLLVARVDDADALVEATVVDVLDVPAGEGEDGVDALMLEHAGDDVAAVDLGHGWSSLRLSSSRWSVVSGQCSSRDISIAGLTAE